MARKVLKPRVKLTPELWGKLESWLNKQKTPPRGTQIAIFLGISQATLYNWADANKDLRTLLDQVQTKRLDYETAQLIAGKMPPNVWRLLAEFNHKLITGYQEKILEIKRQELKLKTAEIDTEQTAQPIHINFEVRTEREEGGV